MTTTDTLISNTETDSAMATSQLSTQPIKEVMREEQELIRRDEPNIPPKVSNEPAEGVNRFLLCTLVSRTAKHVKARAERTGERLPMATIVKGVLHSYQSAAKREHGVLAGSALNLERLQTLLENVMKEEIRRYAHDIVKTNQVRLAQASKLGDETRIKTEVEALERAIASRNRLATEFK